MAPNLIIKDLQNVKASGDKRFAILIDPDHSNLRHLEQILQLAQPRGVDYILLGGSLILNNQLDTTIQKIRAICNIPVVLFPGSALQVSTKADAILFLSLISGRNPEYLIGQQVLAAPTIMASNLQCIPTGYMLIDGGRPTTAQHVSHTFPIPHHKDEVAVATAMAGQLLGLKTIYMDAGSGATTCISTSMIQSVSQAVQIPLIVGGGLQSAQLVYEKAKAGADLIVVGNAIEKDPFLIAEMTHAIQAAKVAI